MPLLCSGLLQKTVAKALLARGRAGNAETQTGGLSRGGLAMLKHRQADCQGRAGNAETQADCQGRAGNAETQADCQGRAGNAETQTDCQGRVMLKHRQADCQGRVMLKHRQADCQGRVMLKQTVTTVLGQGNAETQTVSSMLLSVDNVVLCLFSSCTHPPTPHTLV